MNIPSPLIPVLQQALDKALELNPDVQPIVSELDQKVIQLHIRGIELSVYLIVIDDKVEVSGYFDSEADATVSGTPFALGRMATSTDGLFKGDVEIYGDIAAGRAVKRLFSSIDIDWEDQIATVIGGTAAHQLSRIGRELSSFFGGAANSFSQNTSEYLIEESRLVVSRLELDHFLNRVDSLRADADRLEARIALLEKQTTGESG